MKFSAWGGLNYELRVCLRKHRAGPSQWSHDLAVFSDRKDSLLSFASSLFQRAALSRLWRRRTKMCTR